MGIQLNIKDEATVRLARESAAAAGETVTETIRRALQDQVDRHEAAQAVKEQQLRDLVAGLSVHWHPKFDGVELSTRHGEFLYDERGMPG